jgi:hypothetical protein
LQVFSAEFLLDLFATKMNNRRNTIANAIAILGFALFFSFVALGPYYYSARPRAPHPESGRIFPQRVKGFDGVADVFLTRAEKWPFDKAMWILIAYGALMFTASHLKKRYNKGSS